MEGGEGAFKNRGGGGRRVAVCKRSEKCAARFRLNVLFQMLRSRDGYLGINTSLFSSYKV